MQLKIHPNKLIGDVQMEFAGMFPFLKLEFYRNRGSKGELHSKENILAQNQKISDGQISGMDGVIEIRPVMTVKELEKLFKDEFSLIAQVFRRSRNIWLQTTMTDNWTLSNQNEHGREISMGKVTKSEPGDFDLRRDPV